VHERPGECGRVPPVATGGLILLWLSCGAAHRAAVGPLAHRLKLGQDALPPTASFAMLAVPAEAVTTAMAEVTPVRAAVIAG
jgi:hypothetical protein